MSPRRADRRSEATATPIEFFCHRSSAGGLITRPFFGPGFEYPFTVEPVGAAFPIRVTSSLDSDQPFFHDSAAMPFLLLVSFIWAFSFGLIGRRLTGIDSTAVATLRLVLALLVFLPFFRRGQLPARTALKLALIGAVQFGAMYLLYQRSYLYLPSYAVALFVIPMPLYVTLAAAVFERRWQARYAVAALLAIAGAGAVSFQGDLQRDFVHGFILMQLSNICFAVGQIAWRQVRRELDPSISEASLFALPYAGAVVACVLGSFVVTDWSALHLSGTQWLVLVYLGVISSGACFFWWNLGATRVSAGTLAVMNNAKIPLAVACSLMFFGEKADLPRLAIAAALMLLAVWVASSRKEPAAVN